MQLAIAKGCTTLAYKNKALIICQEIYFSTADNLVIPIMTSWVNLEQDAQPCHICPRAVGMYTGPSVSKPLRG